MEKLLIHVSKKTKNTKFSLAVGIIKIKNEIYKDSAVSLDEKSAVFLLVRKFQEKGISFSEIVLNGTENYFLKTPLEKHVTVLKKPENFFPDFAELKRLATMIRKDASGLNGSFEEGPELRRGLARKPRNDGRLRRASKKNRSNGSEPISTKQLGDRAETIVSEFLVRNGHEIIERNYKTKFYEIDIISAKADKIYFTEVKYRKDEFRGSSLSMITKEKFARMTFAAEAFLKSHKDLKNNFSPLLAVASVSGKDFVLNDWFAVS